MSRGEQEIDAFGGGSSYEMGGKSTERSRKEVKGMQKKYGEKGGNISYQKR